MFLFFVKEQQLIHPLLGIGMREVTFTFEWLLMYSTYTPLWPSSISFLRNIIKYLQWIFKLLFIFTREWTARVFESFHAVRLSRTLSAIKKTQKP